MLFDVAVALKIDEIVLFRKHFNLQKQLMKRSIKMSYLSKSNLHKDKPMHPKIYYISEQDNVKCQFLDLVILLMFSCLKNI